MLEALRLLLKSEGYQTEAVTSPAAILEALKVRKYDLLLMDLNYARDTTSGREGLDLIERIRAADSSLSVIAMTAWASVDIAVEAMQRGVCDFVQKPWENEKLLSILRAHIAQGHAQRKREQFRLELESLRVEVQRAASAQSLLCSAAEQSRRALESRSVVVFTRSPHDHALLSARSHARELESCFRRT